MNRNFLYSLLFLFAGSSRLVSQNPDSLKLALKNAKHDTTRVALYARLSEICEEEEIYNYASRTLALSEKLLKDQPAFKNKWLKFKSDAYNNIGYTLQNKGNNPEALNYYDKSVKIKETIDDPAGLAGTLNNIGFVYNEQGNIEEGLNYYSRALAVFEKLNDKKSVSISSTSFGFNCW